MHATYFSTSNTSTFVYSISMSKKNKKNKDIDNKKQKQQKQLQNYIHIVQSDPLCSSIVLNESWIPSMFNLSDVLQFTLTRTEEKQKETSQSVCYTYELKPTLTTKMLENIQDCFADSDDDNTVVNDDKDLKYRDNNEDEDDEDKKEEEKDSIMEMKNETNVTFEKTFEPSNNNENEIISDILEMPLPNVCKLVESKRYCYGCINQLANQQGHIGPFGCMKE